MKLHFTEMKLALMASVRNPSVESAYAHSSTSSNSYEPESLDPHGTDTRLVDRYRLFDGSRAQRDKRERRYTHCHQCSRCGTSVSQSGSFREEGSGGAGRNAARRGKNTRLRRILYRQRWQ